MADDRRRLDARIRVNQDFEPFDGIIDAYVTDLSRSGAFVRTRAAMAVGARVDLYFTVLHPEMACVEGVGEVVRVQDNPAGVGVVFVSLTPSSLEVIDRVLVTPDGA